MLRLIVVITCIYLSSVNAIAFNNTNHEDITNKIDSLYEAQEFKKTIQKCIVFLNSGKINSENKLKYLKITADCYYKIGDYTNSILFSKKTLPLNKNNSKETISSYIKIAKSYKKLKQKKNYYEAINYLNKAKRLSLNTKDSPKYKLHSIYNNLGNNFSEINELEYSKRYHKLAIDIAIKSDDNEKIQMSYLNLSVLYLNGPNTKKEHLILSEKYLLKGLSYHDKYNATIYRNLAIIKYIENDFEESLNYHKQSLESNLKITLKDKFELPKFESITPNNYNQTINTFYEKIYTLIKLFETTKEEFYLEEGIKTVDYCNTIFSSILNNVEDEKSQLFWRKKASAFYLTGVTICYNLNLPEKALFYVEKNKSVLLLDYIIENELKKALPKELKSKELKLKRNLDYLYTVKIKDSSQKNQDLYFNEKIAYYKFTDSLKKEFPEYFKINESKENYSIDYIKKQIKPNTAYLSFIWDKNENQFDALYGIVITKKETHLYKINNLKLFDSLVTSYNEFLKKPIIKAAELEKFKTQSLNLFNTLFPNDTIRSILNKNRNLTVLPDSDLQKIPLESLITSNKTNKYLIETHNINYAYSLYYLIKNSNIKRNPKNTFVGFAPVHFNYDDLISLPNTYSEVENIKEKVGGNSFTEDLATKESFLEKSNSSKIIHIATHSNETQNPWIAFKKNKLKLNEIYLYDNQAELVFLNSCNSSLGEINPGEGIYSLARGFLYSGANSVISSLWNVNDKSNAEITSSFYGYLKKK